MPKQIKEFKKEQKVQNIRQNLFFSSTNLRLKPVSMESLFLCLNMREHRRLQKSWYSDVRGFLARGREQHSRLHISGIGSAKDNAVEENKTQC